MAILESVDLKSLVTLIAHALPTRLTGTQQAAQAGYAAQTDGWYLHSRVQHSQKA